MDSIRPSMSSNLRLRGTILYNQSIDPGSSRSKKLPTDGLPIPASSSRTQTCRLGHFWGVAGMVHQDRSVYCVSIYIYTHLYIYICIYIIYYIYIDISIYIYMSNLLLYFCSICSWSDICVHTYNHIYIYRL